MLEMVSGFRFGMLDVVSGFRFGVLDLVSGLELWVLDIVSGLGFRGYRDAVRVDGARFLFLKFGFRASVLGPDAGFRAWEVG